MNITVSSKKQPIFLYIIWAAVQLCVFLNFDILTELEAGKYIRQASHLIEHGSFTDSGYIFYGLEILLIAAFKAVHANIECAVIIQLIVNALAVQYLWKIIRDLTDFNTASISTVLFVVFIPIQQFNFQLQTESLFISLIIFHTYFAINSCKGNKNSIWGMLIIQTLLIFSRPTGIIWIIPTTITLYHITRNSVYRKSALLLSTGLIILSLLSIEFVVSKISQFNLITPWENGNIICGGASVDVQSLEINKSEPRSISTPLTIVKDNVKLFLKIAFWKTISFFGYFRPYYSWSHNAYLILFTLPVYLFTIISLITTKRQNQYFLSIPMSGILTTYIMVLLTCDDWHNRFSLSIFSLFLIICAKGIYHIINGVMRKNSRLS